MNLGNFYSILFTLWLQVIGRFMYEKKTERKKAFSIKLGGGGGGCSASTVIVTSSWSVCLSDQWVAGELSAW